MWIGTRIGGAYITMPFLAWMIVAPILLVGVVAWYTFYGAVLGCMMLGRWYTERREQGGDY